MKIVIVGGVAGGATAAARLRRLDEKAEIIMLERGAYISYANCGLPYYIGDEIKDKDDILVQTPESFRTRFNVNVRTQHRVTSIDRGRKQIVIKDIAGDREYREHYDKLILSPGAEPLEPPVLGIENPRIFTLRNVPDAEEIKDFIAGCCPRRVVVVGAGYIGLEMAENLHRLGIFVTIVEMARQVIAPLDPELAAEVHQHLKTKNVEFYLGELVVAFSEENHGIIAHLKSGIELKADFVIMSIGIKPEAKLAKEASLKIGDTGGIVVNDFLQTSDPDIYAVGDAVETTDPIFKSRRLIPLAGPANKQARIAADNIILGNTEKYRGSVGTAIAKVFDMTVGIMGFSERFLCQNKINFSSAIIHSVSHAGYYPGALPMTLKIHFSRPDGKLLGAQAVGHSGVDKAIEVCSLACQNGLTVDALKDMDQAYAPPYSSVRSPVNMIGSVADDILKNVIHFVSWHDVQTMYDNVFLLDVRNPEEVTLGKIAGAHNIPLHELRGRLHEVPHDKKIYVYCAVGLRAYNAARILMQNGYKEVFNVAGGYKTWETATMKQSNEDIFEHYRVNKDDDLRNRDKESAPGQTASPERRSYREIDARGLQCPGPVMRLSEQMAGAMAGENVRVLATDSGFASDIRAWCNVTGNRLVEVHQGRDETTAIIQKASALVETTKDQASVAKEKTIVVFNDDFDRAFAAFVIANGAMAMGKKVTMFFTFWGLNILKKKISPPVKKDMISRIFSMMLPRGAGELKLSKMNMMGIGPVLMHRIMKKKNIESLDILVAKAIQGGAVIIACQMSMDVMGIKREELMDGIQVGGVSTYIEATDSANTNLFI